MRTIQYDAERPVTAGEIGVYRMKNFIAENKRRIRSRSRNNEKKHQTTYSSRRKKPSLKKAAKDALFVDTEYYTYTDAAIQTMQDESDTNNITIPVVRALHRGIGNSAESIYS